MATHGGLIIFHELHIAAPKNKRKNTRSDINQKAYSFFQMNTALHLVVNEPTNDVKDSRI